MTAAHYRHVAFIHTFDDLPVDELLRGFDAEKKTVFREDGIEQEYVNLLDERWDDLHDYIWDEVTDLNHKHWRFKISDWNQELRVARYGVGMQFDWHLDYTPEDGSKIAFSIALNDGYDGGELWLLEAPPLPKLKVGQGVVFPAFVGHKVKKITSGERIVLLGWLTGPRFV